jgi:hypothetical protein
MKKVQQQKRKERSQRHFLENCQRHASWGVVANEGRRPSCTQGTSRSVHLLLQLLITRRRWMKCNALALNGQGVTVSVKDFIELGR